MSQIMLRRSSLFSVLYSFYIIFSSVFSADLNWEPILGSDNLFQVSCLKDSSKAVFLQDTLVKDSKDLNNVFVAGDDNNWQLEPVSPMTARSISISPEGFFLVKPKGFGNTSVGSGWPTWMNLNRNEGETMYRSRSLGIGHGSLFGDVSYAFESGRLSHAAIMKAAGIKIGTIGEVTPIVSDRLGGLSWLNRFGDTKLTPFRYYKCIDLACLDDGALGMVLHASGESDNPKRTSMHICSYDGWRGYVAVPRGKDPVAQEKSQIQASGEWSRLAVYGGDKAGFVRYVALDKQGRMYGSTGPKDVKLISNDLYVDVDLSEDYIFAIKKVHSEKSMGASNFPSGRPMRARYDSSVVEDIPIMQFFISPERQAELDALQADIDLVLADIDLNKAESNGYTQQALSLSRDLIDYDERNLELLQKATLALNRNIENEQQLIELQDRLDTLMGNK